MGIARSGIGWLLAKVLALGSSWVASMYFARALADPAATLGQFYVFETVVSFLMLTSNAGLNGAMSKRISEREDPEEYVVAGTVLSGTILVAVTILVALASPVIVEYFGLGGLAVLFILGLVWALQIRNTASAILEGYSQVGRSGGLGLLDTASRVGFQTGLVFSGFGLVGLMGGAVAGANVAAIGSLVVLVAGVPLPSRDRFRASFSVERARDLLSYAKYLLVSGLATKFYDNIDIVVITAFIGSAATGIYGIGFRFSLLLSVFSGAISSSAMPEISFHFSEENRDRIEEIITDATVFATVLAIPATVGMAIIAEPLIVTAYTPAFRDAALIATIAVGIQIPEGLRSVFGTSINAIDRPDLTFRSGLVLIVANGVLDLILVPTVGIVGAVVASLVGITLATVYLGYHLFRELELPMTVLPIRSLLDETVAAVAMGAIVWGLDRYLELPTIRLLVVLITAGVVSYFAILMTISPSVRWRLLGIVRDFVP